MKRILPTLIIFLFLGLGLKAQIYPVNANLVMPFPHSAFLFDYYQPAATNMQVTVQLNDLTVASQDVKLQFVIEKDNIRLASNPNYQPASPITLTPGVPLVLQGSDLYDALNTNNLTLEGISPAAFNQNGGRLPEGQYSFCVRVLDLKSGKELSLPACTNIFIQMEVPPVLMTPTCETFVQPTTPQIIRFNWQVAGMGQPSFFGQNSYVLHLYQITDPDIDDPKNAVENSKAVKVYTSQPQTQNNFNLDFSTVLLVPGKMYVCRIQGLGPNGRQTFLNDGFGEWCWFHYGYPDDGTLPLNAPFDGEQFEKTDQKVFNWGVSDKGIPGQGYDYKLTIVAMEDTTQSLADAMTNNVAFHEETLPTTTSQDGGNFLLTDALDADKKYAWKVEAFSEGQKVAESEIRSFYSHSLIEEFYASNQKIKVVQTGNADMSNFSGKARIQLSADETDFIDVDFTGLNIREVAGQMILTDGQIDFALSDRDDMEVPALEESNGIGNFEYIAGKIDRDGLKVEGKLKWLLPHAVAPGEATEVIGLPSTFVMNGDGELSGEAGIEPFNTVMLAPNGFEISLKTTSKLQLTDNELVVNVVGSVLLPESVTNLASERLRVEFKDFQSTLDYIEIPNLIGSINGGVAPVADLGLEFIPIGPGVLDFSEDQSPGKLNADKNWKGFYVEEYKTRLNVANFDPTNQITIPERLDLDTTTVNTPFRFWVSGTGLTLKTVFEFNGLENLKFNTFQTETFKGEFEIRNAEFRTVKLSGTTKIPFVDDDREFDFEIPTTEAGLEQGAILDLEDLEFIYNPYGGENRMNFTINRVALMDNQYLALNVDIVNPELNAEMLGVEDFRIYGDNFIGFSGRNTAISLDDPVLARFKDLDVSVTEIGAAYLGGEYAVSLSMESYLSEGFTNAENGGPPAFTMSSVAATEAQAGPGVNIPEPDIEVPEDLADEEEIKPTGFDVSIETPLLDAGAYLLFTGNDPKWGTRFSAGVNASLKVPARYNMGGNMTLGFVDGMDYWYFDVYFEDVDGEGVQVMVPYVGKITNIVGIEGQIFRHVKAKKGEEGDFELDLSPRTQFGAKIFLQFIDPYAKGFLYQADLGLENEIQGEGYEVDNFEQILTGQASFLNINFRTGSSAGMGTVVAAVESAGVADAIIDEIFPQSVEISGTKVTLDSKGLAEGSSIEIGDVDGGEGILLGAKVSSSPGLEIGLAKDGYKIYGKGDATGSGELDLQIPDVMDLKARLENKTKGMFALEVDDLKTTFSGDYGKKKADFAFDYEDISLAMGVDKTQKSGYFNIGIDGKALGAHANISAKTAGLNFDYDDKKFLVDFDGNAKSSRLMLAYGDYKFDTGLNLTDKKGHFLLETPLGEIDVEGGTTYGKFRAEAGSYLFHVESNFAARTGKLGIAFPNHELRGELKSDMGSIFLKKDDFEIGMSGKYNASGGDLHVKEGDFVFDLGADINTSVGYLDLTDGSHSFSTRYDLSDSSYIRYSDASNLYEALLAGGYFRSQVKTGDKHFLLALDKDNIAGQTLFQIPDFMVAANFDASQNLAASNIEVGDHALGAFIRDDSLAIDYANGGLSMGVAGKAGGSGRVYFADADKNLATGFSYDIENSAGAIMFQKDDLAVDIAGNKTAGTGKIDLQYGDDFFRGGLEDSLYVATQVDDYGFSAMRSTDKLTASFSYADNEVAVGKLSNGEFINLTIPSHSFGLARNGADFSARYTSGDLEVGAAVGASLVGFDVKKGNIEVDASADNQKKVNAHFKKDAFDIAVSGDLSNKTYATTIAQDDWTGSASTALSSKDITLGLSKGDIGISGTFNASAQVLEYQLGDFKVKGGLVSSNPSFDIEFGDAKLDFQALLGGTAGPAVNASSPTGMQFTAPNVSFSLGNLGASLSPDLNINLGNVNFTLQAVSASNACNLDLKRNNNPVAFAGNGFDETVNGNRLRVMLNPDDSKNVVLETGDLKLDVSYKCGELPEIAVEKGGKQYVFRIKSDEVLLVYEDNEFSYLKTNQEYAFKKGSDYSFKINDSSLESDLNGYFLNAKADEFSLGTGNTYLLLDKDQVAIHADDKFIELHSDDTYFLQVDPDKNIALTPSALTVNVDSKQLQVSETAMSASDTQQAFAVAVSSDSVSVQKGQYKAFASNDRVQFDKGSDFVKVSPQTLAVKYDDKELSVSSDKEVRYKDSDREFAASETSLYLDYEGKILEVGTDEVRLELASDKKFKVREDLISTEYGGYKVELIAPLTAPAFTYSDPNNSLSLSETEASLLIDGKGVTVGPDKLQVNYDDNYVRFGENDMALRYDRYEGTFVDWTDVRLTNGVQEFTIDETELTAKIDASNTIKAVLSSSSPTLELVHDDTRLAVAKDRAEFDYDGMHYALGTTGDYIRVNEIAHPDEGFRFSQEGITYQFGADKSITAAPRGDWLKLEIGDEKVAFTDKYSLVFSMNNDDYVTTINRDLSVVFVAKGDHSVELNKDDYMVGYTYLPQNIFLRMRRFEDNYIGLLGGKDKYAGFVKPAKDKRIEIGGMVDGLGRASVAVNADKDILAKLGGVDDNFVKLAVDKAKTLALAHIKVAGSDIINYGGEVDVFGEDLPGVAAVGGDGPAHIATLTEKAGGWAVGGIKLRRTIGTNFAFVAQGRIQTGLTLPTFCADGAFATEMRANKFRFKIADKNDYAEFRLLCIPGLPKLFSEEGYADLGYEVNSGGASMDIAFDYKMSAGIEGGFSFSVLGCEIGVSVDVYAHMLFGGEAAMTIPFSGNESPNLSLGPVFAELAAHASLSASACSYSFSISAGISGRLELNGDLEGATAEGTASGHFSVCGLNKSFDFNAKLEI